MVVKVLGELIEFIVVRMVLVGVGVVPDYEDVIDHSYVEEDVIFIFWKDVCLFVVGKEECCVDACTWGSHGSAYILTPCCITKLE